MDKNTIYCSDIVRLSTRSTLKWSVIIFIVIFSVASHAHAQAGPIILRAGKWIGEQLLSYGAGKAIDNLLGLDCENELRQVEANLTLQMKRETKDREKIRAELVAAQSQLKILNSLLRSKPTPVDVDQFRRQLAKDLDKVLLVQEKHDQRITRLEAEVADLTLQLRRLEASPTVGEGAKVSRTFDIAVTASAPWASTGILLAEGERVVIQANGRAATVPGSYSGPSPTSAAA